MNVCVASFWVPCKKSSYHNPLDQVFLLHFWYLLVLFWGKIYSWMSSMNSNLFLKLEEILLNEMEVTSQNLSTFFGNPQVKIIWKLASTSLRLRWVVNERRGAFLHFLWVKVGKTNHIWKIKLFCSLKMMSKPTLPNTFVLWNWRDESRHKKNEPTRTSTWEGVFGREDSTEKCQWNPHSQVYRSKFDL